MKLGTSDGRRAPWVPVLLYHRIAPRPQRDPFGNFVSVAHFESHLRWLRARGYHSVPLPVLEGVLNGDSDSTLPRRPVAITFDDGYADNYEHAWPVLKRHGFHATVFVVSGAIGRDSAFDDAYPPSPMLSARQIREMCRDGVTVGSHTCSHPQTLVALSDRDLAEELTRSRHELERVAGQPVTMFAYPHSKHDARVEDAVAAAGYRIAFGGTGARFNRNCVARVHAPDGPGAALGVAIVRERLKRIAKRR